MANTMSALQALNAVFTKEQAEVLLALLPENYEIVDISGLADSLSDIEGRLYALENPA